MRPVVAVIHLQLLAYHIGRLKGLDVDETGGLLPAERLAAAASAESQGEAEDSSIAR